MWSWRARKIMNNERAVDHLLGSRCFLFFKHGSLSLSLPLCFSLSRPLSHSLSFFLSLSLSLFLSFGSAEETFNGYGFKHFLPLWSPLTHRPALFSSVSETRLAGDQKQDRTFPGSVLFANVALLVIIRSWFHGGTSFPLDELLPAQSIDSG